MYDNETILTSNHNILISKFSQNIFKLIADSPETKSWKVPSKTTKTHFYGDCETLVETSKIYVRKI